MPYQRGSGFVGLQDYLGANREAAAQMGNSLASEVERQGQAAMGAIDQQAAATQQQISAGTPEFNTFGLEPDEEALLRARVAQGYTGPQDMGNVDAVSAQARKASETAELAGTDTGRAVLLQRGATGPYNLGARTLDAFLAGRGAGARLDAARGKFGELQKYLGTAQGNVANAVNEAKARTLGMQQQAAASTPQYAQPGAPPPAPPAHPRVKNARDIEEERRRQIIARGGKG